MQGILSQTTLQAMRESFHITFKTHPPRERNTVTMQQPSTIFWLLKQTKTPDQSETTG